ncbi:MAG: FAD:protein FMN transferase, partial [Actinomycetes bacterium]
MTSPHPSLTWSQWSTTVTVVTRGDDLERVVAAVRTELAAVDTSCNRFRPDSELSVINASATGKPVAVSPVLQCYLQSALAMAEATDGLVDPTLGATLRRLGYDADIDEVRQAPRRVTPTMVAATKGTWRDVELLERDDEPGAWLRLPAGLELDLGATAKALAADRSAAAGHAVSGQAVLVSLGGDLAMAGSGSEPWLVDVSETAHPMDDGHSSPDQVVVGDGGIATSTTLARRWLTARGTAHH